MILQLVRNRPEAGNELLHLRLGSEFRGVEDNFVELRRAHVFDGEHLGVGVEKDADAVPGVVLAGSVL